MHGFTWASLIFGPAHQGPRGVGIIATLLTDLVLKDAILHAVIVAFIIIPFLIYAVRSKGDDILPEGGITIRNMFELGVEWLLGLMEEIIGPHYRKYTPLVFGCFFYILIANLFGLVPFFGPPTSAWSVTVSMALVVFFATHIYGVAANGLGYFKHFISPMWPPNAVLWMMSVIYLPIELISHLARVLSLSLRLMANMMADHTVLTIFLMLTPWLIPTIFFGLGAMVCLIQAFIFTVLSIVYIGMAVQHHDEEHEEHEHAH